MTVIAFLVATLLFRSGLVWSMSMSAKAAVPSTKQKLVLHWFRNGDLRLHDNPALVHSSKIADYVIPIVCLDDKEFFGDHVRTPFGSLKCGPKRARFLLESVSDLSRQLQCMGSALTIVTGRPREAFGQILTRLKYSSMDIRIVCQEELLKEETNSVAEVRAALRDHRGKVSLLEEVWGSTLYDLKDLPFNRHLEDMPDVFTPFRTKVEKNASIKKPLPRPTTLRLPPQESVEYQALSDLWSSTTSIPNLQRLGYTDEQLELGMDFDSRGVLHFHGGESAGLARLKEYIWDKDLLKGYFDTRNGMLGGDYSTKLSPWLAHGCVSARQVAMECHKYEQERVVNKSTYWLVFELLWRDYCKFFAYKHRNRIFFPGGTNGSKHKWSTFDKNFEAWKDGRTGYPLVDANMRELKATGFMSNRGRQNVASFLAIDLGFDWRFGADWFESNLIDYDVYSNWVNWCAAAGMTGGRLNRFNIVKQSKDYDQHGDYVRHWLPEIKNVPNEFVHEPWKMTAFNQVQYGVRLGVDYPNPIVSPSRPIDDGKKGQNTNMTNRDRRPNNNNSNRHQKYEMKSLKKGGYHIEG